MTVDTAPIGFRAPPSPLQDSSAQYASWSVCWWSAHAFVFTFVEVLVLAFTHAVALPPIANLFAFTLAICSSGTAKCSNMNSIGSQARTVGWRSVPGKGRFLFAASSSAAHFIERTLWAGAPFAAGPSCLSHKSSVPYMGVATFCGVNSKNLGKQACHGNSGEISKENETCLMKITPHTPCTRHTTHTRHTSNATHAPQTHTHTTPTTHTAHTVPMPHTTHHPPHNTPHSPLQAPQHTRHHHTEHPEHISTPPYHTQTPSQQHRHSNTTLHTQTVTTQTQQHTGTHTHNTRTENHHPANFPCWSTNHGLSQRHDVMRVSVERTE